jgi:hypothetical protein
MASNLAQAQPTMAFQWDVRTSAPGTLATGNNAGAEAAVASLSPAVYDFLNFTDPQTNGGGPGRFGADLPFATDTGVDDNNFAVSATGDLVILTAGEYLLGFEGDDGGYLEIAGAPGAGFSRIVENATGAATIQSVNGGTNNRLNTDVPTGNSRTVGQIYLPAGEYTLKTLFFEIGGGAYYEVYGSAYSTAPINFNKASSLTLLKADASYPPGIPTVTLDAISSPALVSKPTVDLSGALPAYSFGAGNSFSVTFASSPGLVYSLEYSTDLVNWSKAGAAYGSAGATTTISGLLTGLPSPLQANAPRIFFRVNGAY